MTAHDPIGRRGVPAGRTAHAVETHVVEQWLSALRALHRRQELESLAARVGDGPLRAAAHHHLAILLASEGESAAALQHARSALTLQPDIASTRVLLFRLLLAEADDRQQSEDWTGLEATLTDAMAYAPADGSADRELARFAQSLPAACVRNNRRQEAVELWERALASQTPEPHLLHNLALLHDWWATQEEERIAADPSAAHASPPWEAAIAYWTAAAQHELFWTEWRRRRERSWGLALSDDDISQMPSALLEERLVRRFQDWASRYRQMGLAADAARHDAYLAAAVRERRSAEAWRAVIAWFKRSPERESLPPLLTVPGGYLFFERLDLLDAVRARAATMAIAAPDEACLLPFGIQFSPNGLGLISALVEGRSQFDEGLSRLDALPAAARNTAEADWLRATALAGRAAELGDRHAIDDALQAWIAARTAAQRAYDRQDVLRAYRAPLQSIIDSAGDAATRAVQREATRLKNAEQLEAAIGLLERCHAVFKTNGVRDYLCVYYCDRGSLKLGEKKFAAARTEFERALKLDSKNQRARGGMSVAYNNESVSLQDPRREIALLDKALEYDPNNGPAKNNLAVACNARGVELLKQVGPYTTRSTIDEAVGLFRRSARLLRPALTDEMLTMIETVGALGGSQLEALLRQVDNENLKVVLTHLGLAAGIRRQVRGY